MLVIIQSIISFVNPLVLHLLHTHKIFSVHHLSVKYLSEKGMGLFEVHDVIFHNAIFLAYHLSRFEEKEDNVETKSP